MQDGNNLAMNWPNPGQLLIVGNRGGTNVAESFARSATILGYEFDFADASLARSSLRLVNALCWHVFGRRSAHMRQFGSNLVKMVDQTRPCVLITTGLCPVSPRVLRDLRGLNVVCLHYSTDDPWNAGQRANWFLSALPLYDIVFTPRRSNIDDLMALGCPRVRYLPFAYDEHIFSRNSVSEKCSGAPEVLFVGGADNDRVKFIEHLLAEQISLALVGGYWDRYRSVKAYAVGKKTPNEIVELTRHAKVNLCLVRRANRDGHVMRSFEIAAIGSCMVVEDTAEHRDIFGPDGVCVLYFRSPSEAAERIRQLLGNTALRNSLASAVSERIVGGGHTYTHRLNSMLEAAQELAYLRRSRVYD
jgi:spore maturation protein CgeB